MAWPNTPLTTYIPGMPPAIQAADLNAFQSAINRIINGTYSLRGVVVDGTGGSVVVPTVGAVLVAALLTGTTVPTTAYADATLGVGTVCSGWARFTGAAALLRGFNVELVERTPLGAAQGDYRITFCNKRSDPDNVCAWVTVVGNGTPAVADITSFATGANQMLRVRVYDLAGTATDRAICCGYLCE